MSHLNKQVIITDKGNMRGRVIGCTYGTRRDSNGMTGCYFDIKITEGISKERIYNNIHESRVAFIEDAQPINEVLAIVAEARRLENVALRLVK